MVNYIPHPIFCISQLSPIWFHYYFSWFDLALVYETVLVMNLSSFLMHEWHFFRDHERKHQGEGVGSPKSPRTRWTIAVYLLRVLVYVYIENMMAIIYWKSLNIIYGSAQNLSICWCFSTVITTASNRLVDAYLAVNTVACNKKVFPTIHYSFKVVCTYCIITIIMGKSIVPISSIFF